MIGSNRSTATQKKNVNLCKSSLKCHFSLFTFLEDIHIPSIRQSNGHFSEDVPSVFPNMTQGGLKVMGLCSAQLGNWCFEGSHWQVTSSKNFHRDRLLKMPGGYLHPVLGRGHTHGILQVQTFISKNLPKSCW